MTPAPTPLLFAPRHSHALGQRIAGHLAISLAAAEEREFDGGEHKMRPLIDVRHHDVVVVHSLCGCPDASANDKLCRLAFFVGALKDAGARHVTTCIPYLAYARKDRRTQPRDPTTLRYVATMLESIGIERVIVLDVHNDAAFDNAFRCETIRLDTAGVFVEHLAGQAIADPVVVSPDLGGIKRAQRFQALLEARLGRPSGFAFMEKKRAGGVVSGERLVGDVAGCDLLFIDDMIASGTTMQRAVRAARAAGARSVRLLATHPVFTPAAQQLFATEGPDQVVVTDSVDLTADFACHAGQRLSVCSVGPLFADTIRAVTQMA